MIFHNEPSFSLTSQVDSMTGWLKTISGPHHETHEGNSYYVVYSALAADEAAISIRIKTPNSNVLDHTTIHVETALAATIQMWMSTTKTHNASNEIIPLNKDFNSSKLSGTQVCHTPGGSQAGAARLTQYIGSATTNGKTNSGGVTSSRGEFILKANTAYLITVTSRAAANAMSIILDWYEHLQHI